MYHFQLFIFPCMARRAIEEAFTSLGKWGKNQVPHQYRGTWRGRGGGEKKMEKKIRKKKKKAHLGHQHGSSASWWQREAAGTSLFLPGLRRGCTPGPHLPGLLGFLEYKILHHPLGCSWPWVPASAVWRLYKTIFSLVAPSRSSSSLAAPRSYSIFPALANCYANSSCWQHKYIHFGVALIDFSSLGVILP